MRRSGWKAPGFELKDVKGQTIRLDDFKGKVVLVHFFASWCEPCKKEFPALVRLRGLLKERGFEIVAVSEDSLERTAPFADSLGADFPVVIDRYGGVMRSYKVKLIPTSVVIDKNGEVSGIITGPREYEGIPSIGFFESLLN